MSHTQRANQSPDRQKPVKEPSSKYYPFLWLSVSSLILDCSISLVRVYWNSFSLLFTVKLCGIMFSSWLTVDE